MKKVLIWFMLLLTVASLVLPAAAQSYEQSSVETDALPYEGWLICVGIGIAVGLVAVLIMKGQLKSVRPQRSAGSYVVDGSFHLTTSREMFLYRTVSKREIQSNNGK